MKKYYYSVDVGGTSIKAGIVNEDGEILFSENLKTVPAGTNYLAESIIILLEKLEKNSELEISKSSGIGIGLPGLIDSKNGILKYSGNLKLRDYPITQELSKKFSVPIKIANDADIATLAEKVYGAGKGYDNFIMITIGTGIGGGIVIGGKIITEHTNYAGEIGHIKITQKNVKCSCGSKGCWEALASTKALVQMTQEAMQKHPESKMWKTYTPDMVTGKTVFEYLGEDETADKLFEEYISFLGDGLVNLVNVLTPELIVVGGAISAQKNKLNIPLENYVNEHIFAKNAGYKINIVTAKYTGNAGILGGKCLFD